MKRSEIKWPARLGLAGVGGGFSVLNTFLFVPELEFFMKRS